MEIPIKLMALGLTVDKNGRKASGNSRTFKTESYLSFKILPP